MIKENKKKGKGGMKRRFVVCLVQVFIFLSTSSVYSQSQLETNLQTEKEENQKIVFTPKQQELRISANDIKLIEDKENGGYHLYVKKNPKVNSILLTETTKDPLGKNDSYAYRAKEYNLRLCGLA